MSTSNPEAAEAQQVALLTALCVDNPQLEQLDTMLAELNMFEAAGLTRDEVKHSRFLSFLLNPREAHGLGDAFLTRMLQKSIQASGREDLAISPIELELWDMSDSEVRTEWSGIDILMLNHTHRVAIVIENKIGSGEHTDQLKRYYATIRQHFGDWKVLPLFLSPSGVPPSDERFVPVTYELIVTLVDHFLANRASSLSVAMQTVLTHYVQLLRRHVVSDSTVKELCQEIYRKHRKAIDLIFEYRQDRWAALRETAAGFVEIGDLFERTGDRPYQVCFIPQGWKKWMPTSDDRRWSKAGWPLLFWFDFTEKEVFLRLDIGPCDRTLGKSLLDAANANKPPLNPQSRVLNKQTNRIFRLQMVGSAALSSSDEGRINNEFSSRWHSFLARDFDGIEKALRSAAYSKIGE